MSAWIVYSKDGNTERCRLKRLEYSGAHMGERTVTATFDSNSEVAFDVFDYIEYRGEKFELESIPSVKKTSNHNYEYELRFVSLKYELERCEMRDIVPNDNGIVYPTPLTFSFTGDVAYLAERIQANLDALYGTGVWSIIVAEGVTSEDKNITISQQNCWNALTLVSSTYELDFTVKGRTVTIGGNKPSVSHIFQYGKGNGLYEIERTADTETGIVTKIRAYGSTKNLDYSYPKKPEWSDSALDTSFVLSPLRLMLPSFKNDGKTDYIMADDSLVEKYGIREASVIYEDIYPSITGATNSKGEAIDEIKAVDDIDDSKSTFAIHLHDLGFDLEENLTTANAQVSMKTGAMQGYTFNIADNGIERLGDGSYKLTLGRITANSSDTGNYDIPNSKWNMKAGDKFVFLNILMPQEYIRSAENRLLERAKEYLAEYGKTNFSYNVGLHDKFLKQNQSVYNELIEGSKLSVHDEELGISEDVTIQSISITENMEDNILPQVKVTLNNKPSASTLDRIQGQIKELSETTSGTFSSQSELLKQYRKKLDKPFFDRLFVAVGLDGKELASTDTNSPIAYIKAKYSFATIGGVTMYAQDGSVDIPTIAEGLPFDNRTIWFNSATGQIEVIGGTGGGTGGGSGEGVSNFWDLNGIPLWITNTKPTYSYSEIQGTPDLSKYALVSQIPSLEGYALSSDLAKYIPISGYTDITGEKNFTGGLKVNDSPIYYDIEKKYWKLEGDLLVTGGVTMYGNDSDFVASTIMDAILYDNTTLGINAQGQLYVKGSVGGATTLGSLSNVGSWADSVAPQDRIMYQAANSSQWIAKNLSDLAVGGVVGDYLPLTGGTLSGALTISNGNEWIPIKINRAEWGESTFVVDSSGLYISHTIGSASAYLQLHPTNGFKFNGSVILHSNNYSSYALPLSGGTITNTLTIDNSNAGLILHRSGQATPYIRFGQDANNEWGELGVYNDGRLVFWSLVSSQGGYGQWNTIWHSGNDGSGSGLNADLLDGFHISNASKPFGGIPFIGTTGYMDVGSNIDFHYDNTTGSDYSVRLKCTGNHSVTVSLPSSGGTLALTTDNVASATKLQTARTIWGQSFDGTGNVSGILYLGNNNPINANNSSGTSYNILNLNQGNALTLGYGTAQAGYGTYIDGYDVFLRYGTSRTTGLILNSSGNVGIGTTSPSAKLHIVGDVNVVKPSTANQASLSFMNTSSDLWQISGRYGSSENGTFKTYYYNGTTWSTIMTLYNNGNMLVSGGITMYSARKLKNITDERGLSLEELSVIKPTRFTWKDGRDNKVHIGGIADDVMKVLPEVIYKADNDTLTMDYGNAAFAIAASLIKPVVSHEERIKVLEEENKRLKEEVEQLKWNIA